MIISQNVRFIENNDTNACQWASKEAAPDTAKLVVNITEPASFSETSTASESISSASTPFRNLISLCRLLRRQSTKTVEQQDLDYCGGRYASTQLLENGGKIVQVLLYQFLTSI